MRSRRYMLRRGGRGEEAGRERERGGLRGDTQHSSAAFLASGMTRARVRIPFPSLTLEIALETRQVARECISRDYTWLFLKWRDLVESTPRAFQRAKKSPRGALCSAFVKITLIDLGEFTWKWFYEGIEVYPVSSRESTDRFCRFRSMPVTQNLAFEKIEDVAIVPRFSGTSPRRCRIKKKKKKNDSFKV